jgi:hypothetical protein
LLPLKRRVQWQQKFTIPMKVLDTLADNAEALAGVLTGGTLFGKAMDKLADKFPKFGPLARKGAIPAMIIAVDTLESQLRQINEQARQKHDYLTATLTQFKLDLDRGETDRLLIRGK